MDALVNGKQSCFVVYYATSMCRISIRRYIGKFFLIQMVTLGFIPNGVEPQRLNS